MAKLILYLPAFCFCQSSKRIAVNKSGTSSFLLDVLNHLSKLQRRRHKEVDLLYTRKRWRRKFKRGSRGRTALPINNLHQETNVLYGSAFK